MDCVASTGCSWRLARAPANTRGSPCNRRTALQQRDWTRRTAERVRGDVNSLGSPSLTSMEATQCKCDPYWLHSWPDFSTDEHEKIFFSPPSLPSCWAHFLSRCGRSLENQNFIYFIYIFFSNNAHLTCARVCS